MFPIPQWSSQWIWYISVISELPASHATYRANTSNLVTLVLTLLPLKRWWCSTHCILPQNGVINYVFKNSNHLGRQSWEISNIFDSTKKGAEHIMVILLYENKTKSYSNEHKHVSKRLYRGITPVHIVGQWSGRVSWFPLLLPILIEVLRFLLVSPCSYGCE